METKYYVIEIATGDAKIAGKSIYEYTNKTDAVASFHSKLGTAMKSELYTTDLLMVVDSKGNWYEQKYFDRSEEN